MAESAGMLLKIKADSSQATAEMKKFKDDLKAIEKASKDTLKPLEQTAAQSGLTAAQFTTLKTGALAAAAGITAIAAVAATTALALFTLSKNAAEYGSQIFDASQKTGLGAATLSALKIAAEQSGSSFEAITNNVSKFNVLLGQAAAGNEKAEKILKQYGITATDTNKALEQAMARIAGMTSASDRAAAATALFKDRTGDVLTVIRSFNGDLPGLIDKMRELGLVMSDEDARAADEFGDQMDTLNAQLGALGRQIGFAFMPIFRDMAKYMTDFFSRNQFEVRMWANNIVLTLEGLKLQWNDLKKAADDYYISSALGAIASIDPLMRHVKALGELTRARAAAERAITSGKLRADFTIDPTAGETPQGRHDDSIIDPGAADRAASAAEAARKKAEREREAARKKAEQLADRDLAAQIRIEANNLQEVQKSMQKFYDAMRKTLAEGGAVEGFVEATNEGTKQWAENIHLSLVYIEELERKALSKDATVHERALLQQQQESRRHQIKLDQDKEVDDNQKAYDEERYKRRRLEADFEEQEFNRKMERLEREREEMGLNNIPVLDNLPLPGLTDPNADEQPGPFDAWTDSWNNFVNAIESQVGNVQNALGTMAGILQNAFQGVANAIGQVIQQWVIYGTTGTAVMRKILAAALASIAAEAAVRAIYALAYGFLMLALGDYYSAGQAFIAAAVFGTIAGVAALAGRAVAGDAFKQQTAGATGQTGSNRQGSTNREGGAYSGLEPETREMGINRAQPSEVHIKLGLDTDGVITVLESNSRSNGRFRFLVQNLAEGNA